MYTRERKIKQINNVNHVCYFNYKLLDDNNYRQWRINWQ